jgi:hypothetical protein
MLSWVHKVLLNTEIKRHFINAIIFCFFTVGIPGVIFTKLFFFVNDTAAK